MPDMYTVKIIMRDGGEQTTSDDYHATVTRHSDGAEFIWISTWRWLLKWKTRDKAVRRVFKSYDKRQKKLEKVEQITR